MGAEAAQRKGGDFNHLLGFHVLENEVLVRLPRVSRAPDFLRHVRLSRRVPVSALCGVSSRGLDAPGQPTEMD